MTFTTAGSDHVYIQGKVSWVKYITPDPTYNKWSITVHPNDAGLKILQDLQTQGVKNQLKKDEDGYFYRFSRPTERKLKSGAVKGMTAPIVLKYNPETKKGDPIEGVAIGNGSDGTVKLEVYSHKTPSGGQAKAARWESLMIDNLIPFNKDTDFPDPAQKEQAAGLDEQPTQLF